MLIVIVLILHSVSIHMQAFSCNQIHQSRLVSMQSPSTVCNTQHLYKDLWHSPGLHPPGHFLIFLLPIQDFSF